MGTKETVSILIPTYNAEKWLAETIESALNQTYPKIEIIIVDDGSTDSSYAIANSFTSSIIKVIQQENRGCGAARNRALQEAQGTFIQFLDADDLLAPDKIEWQVNLLKQDSNFDCVASGAWARFLDSLSEAKFIPEPIWNDMTPIDWLICSWEGGGMMHPAAWLIPRKISERVGLFDEVPCPDAEGEYITRVLLKSRAILFCKEARSFYRSGIQESLSRVRTPEMLVALYRSIELSINYLLSVEDSLRTRKACATAIQRFIYGAYPDLPDLVMQAEAKVNALGGSELKPLGGSIFQLVSFIAGWKMAKKVQKLVYRHRFNP
jgi:glycosyltransferase involved in cell wall biosynthesis